MPITIADVATRAGVSKTTVSRVLNGKGEVHVRTADRVRAGYAGEPVEDVCRRLLDETRSGLHPDIAAGFQPDMDEFCRVAVAIVRGELT